MDKTLKTLPAELIDKINFYNLSGRQILERLAEETYIDENQVLHLSRTFRLLFPQMQRFSIPLSEFKYPDFDESAMPEVKPPNPTSSPSHMMFQPWDITGSPPLKRLGWEVYDENVEIRLGEYDGLVEGDLEKMLSSRFAFKGNSAPLLSSEDFMIWPNHNNIQHISVAPHDQKIYIRFENVGPYRRHPDLHIEVKPIQVNNRGGFVRGEIVARMEEYREPSGTKQQRKRAREE